MRGRSTFDWNTGEPTVCMTKADIARYAKEATARVKRKDEQTAALIAPSQPVIAYSKAAPKRIRNKKSTKEPCHFFDQGEKDAESLLSTELSTKDTHVLSHLSQGELANR